MILGLCSLFLLYHYFASSSYLLGNIFTKKETLRLFEIIETICMHRTNFNCKRMLLFQQHVCVMCIKYSFHFFFQPSFFARNHTYTASPKSPTSPSTIQKDSSLITLHITHYILHITAAVLLQIKS